jgi:8-oxo-dGTP diphosphatase
MEFRDYDTRLAAYALIVDEHDRILLALWNEVAEPRWTLPGGGVELPETVEEAAVRDLREETGYDVELAGSWASTPGSWTPATGWTGRRDR